MKKRDRSDASHAILDAKSRAIKAEKIVTVLKQKTDLAKARVLDIGTGAGYIASHLAKSAKEVTSIDVVDERRISKAYKFKIVDSELLPFSDNSFDIVISNHVIEHVSGQQKHIDEIFRVLKPEGIVYLATPNRYWITDPHYRIPFINWMPRPVAKKYLHVTQKKEWDVRPVSLAAIKKYANGRYGIERTIVDIIKKPEQYHLDTFRQIHPLIKRFPIPLLKLASKISPTLILVMKKKA